MLSHTACRLLTILASVGFPALADAQHHEASGDQKLGAVTFATSCSPSVQPHFNRAVTLLHSFWYEEAERQFRAAAEGDPACAIARWGVAMTHWHPVWEPRGPNPEALQQGTEAIQKAASLAASERERDYIAALEAFYAGANKIDHTDRVLAYEKAMEKLHRRYPDDPEATLFYALALLGSATSSPPDPSYARQKKAGELLQPLFRGHPNHPGVAHYIIHAYDYPALASGALEAARRYATIAPDSPHARHMPSHIFTRLGLWQESIASNRAAAAAARKHSILGEELHALDYLVFAHLQLGEDRKAREIVDRRPAIREGVPLYFAGLHATASIPARYAIERRQWAKAAALAAPSGFPGGRYAWADAAIYFARALGAARSGKLEQARRDVEKLASFRETLMRHKEDYWARQVEIQQRAAEAWMRHAEGRHDEALEMMQSAVALEAATDKHPVTPGYIVPARDLLGQMLLELNRSEAALVEFTKVLEEEPNRFGAIYGAARAAELADERQRARELYGKLVELAPDSERNEVRHAREFLSDKTSL